MQKAIITVGLGFGDEGKGSTVDFLCRKLKADLVVRYCGGSQCGHNVQLPNGFIHTFSQFGAGTLAGVPTHLDSNVIIYPEAMLKEAEHLVKGGISAPFDTLSISERCLVSTLYHRAANRINEIARGESKHGSCGHGIGETRKYWLQYGFDSIFAKDLQNYSVLVDKLELMRQRFLIALSSVDVDNQEEARVFDFSTTTVAKNMIECARSLDIVDYVPDFKIAIFEGAQGVLLDEWHGFHPYTTWSTVTPHHAKDLLRELNVEKYITLGVIRSYMTRHGAGPLPTECNDLKTKDKSNLWNKWQGDLRLGHLDMSLLKYSISAIGKLEGLVVNCLDEFKEGEICLNYPISLRPSNKSIPIMESNTDKLNLIKNLSYETVSRDGLLKELNKLSPVVIQSFGPTYENKESLAIDKLFDFV